jgi:hypothetical protein
MAGSSPRSNNVGRIVSPIKGIDIRSSISIGSPEFCVYTYNLVPFEYGLRVRKGYREWQTDVGTAAAFGVQTLVPFDGIEETGENDKLFAMNNEGIWDVTIAGAAPISKFTFADQTEDAGYGSFAHYVGNAGTTILFYADSKNGLFSYDPAGDIWAQAVGITGPTVTNIRFVVLHKQRLWLVEEDSADAWYLPVGSISGAATKFSFGSKFSHGGNLSGLYNWSVDSGNGLDDFLVAVSRAGDVLPYQGTDPVDADSWGLKGTYFIGAVPRGPNIGTEQGGNLYLLSAFGLTSLSDLLQGVDTPSTRGENTISGRISGVLRDRIGATLDNYGWGVQVIPSEGAMLVTTPRIDTGPFIQYSFNIATAAWGFWRDAPIRGLASWRGEVAFGTTDNRICYMDVNRDNVTLIPPVGRINGDAIKFSILSSFQDLGAPGVYKQIGTIRADFVGKNKPGVLTKALYDFDVAEIGPSPGTQQLNLGAWDIGEWDQSVWGSGVGQPYETLQGNWGIGRYTAVAMRGESVDELTFVGWDVIFRVGGMLR